MAEPSASAPPLTVIRPHRGWSDLGLAELWAYRELLAMLAWRDLAVRYNQTALGVAWILIQPLFMTLALSLTVGRLAAPGERGAYALQVMCGLLPWTLVARALADGGGSLSANQRLIGKVYFPRLALPVAAVLAACVDLVIACAAAIVVLVLVGCPPGPAAFLLPLVMLHTLLLACAVALWVAALDGRYRDVRHTIPFLGQWWLLTTPIAYPLSAVPDGWRWLFQLNPLASLVEEYRWCLLAGAPSASMPALVGAGVGSAALLALGGLALFRRFERDVADTL